MEPQREWWFTFLSVKAKSLKRRLLERVELMPCLPTQVFPMTSLIRKIGMRCFLLSDICENLAYFPMFCLCSLLPAKSSRREYRSSLKSSPNSKTRDVQTVNRRQSIFRKTKSLPGSWWVSECRNRPPIGRTSDWSKSELHMIWHQLLRRVTLDMMLWHCCSRMIITVH